jgi:hypothetical protein
MHLKVSDGIYCEVGGTSTNVGVIRNGRPTVTYARVGGHETYVSSLDVRVVGIAGGSLIRVRDGRISDVGPRSAHIAGLPYAAFAPASAIVAPRLELIEPIPGDGDDWVAVRVADGTRFALTTSCAANVLGLAKPGHHAYAGTDSARLAFAPLAEVLGLTVEEAARAVLDRAAAKVAPVVAALVKEYQLDPDQCLLVGEGGGAAALIPHLAQSAGLDHVISTDAEVISSIGVALALVRDVVERIVPHPKPEDLEAVRLEAIQSAVRLGADPRSVEVTVEVDRFTHRVRAIATGAAEMSTAEVEGAIPEREARTIAARSLGVGPGTLQLAAATPRLRVYRTGGGEAGGPARAIDHEGTIRFQRSRAVVRTVPARSAVAVVEAVWRELAAGTAESPSSTSVPGLLVAFGHRLVDLSGVETEAQATTLAATELAGEAEDTTVAVIGFRQGA